MTQITQLPDNGLALARLTLRSPGSSAIAIAAALDVLDYSEDSADVALCAEWRAKMIAPRADYAVDPWGGHVNIGPQNNDMRASAWSRHHARQAQERQRRRLMIIVIAAGALLAMIAANAVIARTTATVEAAQNWKG